MLSAQDMKTNKQSRELRVMGLAGAYRNLWRKSSSECLTMKNLLRPMTANGKLLHLGVSLVIFDMVIGLHKPAGWAVRVVTRTPFLSIWFGTIPVVKLSKFIVRARSPCEQLPKLTVRTLIVRTRPCHKQFSICDL